MKKETARKILEKNKRNYDQIAVSWDQTRQKPLIGSSDFLKYLKSGDKVLDVGCGNGRIVKLFDNVNVEYTGIDNSQELIKLAKKNFPRYNFLVGDIFELPFENNSFDVVFCLSVLHHLPGKQLRKEALIEIKRVLKPGGFIIFSNWSYLSPKMISRFINFTFKKLFSKSGLDFGDIYLGWGNTDVKRYVHLFTKLEIKRLLHSQDFKVVKNYISTATSRGFKNIVTIARA